VFRFLSIRAMLPMLLLSLSCGSKSDTPHEWQGAYNRGLALIQMGMNEEATGQLEEALKVAPERYDVLETYWKLRFKRDYNAADELRGEAKGDPGNANFQRLMSLLLKDPEERLKAGRTAIRLVPGEPQAYKVMGDIFDLLEMPDSSAAYYSRAVEMDPTGLEAAIALAGLKRKTGDLAGAETIYRAIVDGEGGSPDEYGEAVRDLFSLYWDGGDYSDAVEVAGTAKLRVEDPWVLNSFAWTLADADIKTGLAEALALKAISGMTGERFMRKYPEIDAGWADETARRNQGYFYDTLGYAYRRAGETDKAIDAFEKAVERTPYIDSDLQIKLASAYKEAGRPEDAIESLLSVVSVSRNEEASAQLQSDYIEVHGDTAGLGALVADRRRKGMKPAADFTMSNLNGNSVTLSDYTGKVVMLEFWFPT